MSEFNLRTTVNHRIHQDALTTQRRSRMARQRIEYHRRVIGLRKCVRTVAVDAAMIGATLASSVILLACWVG